MYAQYNQGPSFNPRFNSVAQEVLRTSNPPGFQQPPIQNPIPQMPFNFGSPKGGISYIPGPNGIPMPHATGWQVQNLQNLLEIKRLQDEINDEQTEEEKDAYYDNLLRMLDKQRDVLTKFLGNLNQNKGEAIHEQMKELNRQIKMIEKENILKQIKINDEQAQLYRNLNAAYEFDADQYKLSDTSDSEDEDEDILLEILSNKVYFKKIKSLLNKKKKKPKIIKKPTKPTNPTYSSYATDDSFAPHMQTGYSMPMGGQTLYGTQPPMRGAYPGSMSIGQYTNSPTKRSKASKKKPVEESDNDDDQ